MRSTARAMTWSLAWIAAITAGAAALHGQAIQEWSLRTVASIGGAHANDDRYVFDAVTTDGIAGRANGNLLVLDAQGKRVLEYDASGRHVRTFGRSGEGPGEFRFPTAIALGAGDSLWVFDVGRITVFPPAAGKPRTIQTETRTFGVARVQRGTLVRALSAVPSAAGGAGSLVPTSTLLVRFDQRAAVQDTIWAGPMPRRVLVTVRNGNNTSSTHAVEQYGVATHWDQLRDGTLVISDTSAYLLRLVSLEGRELASIGTKQPARRVTAADRERALARVRAAQARNRDGRFAPSEELLRKQLEQTPFATVVPRVAAVRVDAQDRIWVGVSGDDADLERIDIYDRRGALIALVANPGIMPAAVYGNGYAALLERDDTDAQRIRVVRVASSH